jgi:hypothetical protein
LPVLFRINFELLQSRGLWYFDDDDDDGGGGGGDNNNKILVKESLFFFFFSNSHNAMVTLLQHKVHINSVAIMNNFQRRIIWRKESWCEKTFVHFEGSVYKIGSLTFEFGVM